LAPVFPGLCRTLGVPAGGGMAGVPLPSQVPGLRWLPGQDNLEVSEKVKIIFLSCLLVVLIPRLVHAGRPIDVVDLGRYRWKNRLLFLFSPSSEIPAYQSLNRELNRNHDGVRDRDLLVFRILEQGSSAMDSQEISPQGAINLRRRFGVNQGTFTVVLVGKDGGVKLQRPGPVSLSDIFGLIDSMPMRQREMQEK
jgi:hypothetical protein